MVKKGIVLGHIISIDGIEVDKGKTDLIVNLPPPTCAKEVRFFCWTCWRLSAFC